MLKPRVEGLILFKLGDQQELGGKSERDVLVNQQG